MHKPDVYIEQIETGPMANFIYLVGSERTKKVAFVDPAWDVESLFGIIKSRGLELGAVLVTHTHFDHINGLEFVVKEKSVPVYVHKKEASCIEPIVSRPQCIEDNDTIDIDGLKVSVIHTPGHSPGSVCYLLGRNLITGDTLFVGGCGRWDLPGGDVRLLYESLVNKLALLDDQIVIYPGHHYGDKPTATILEQRHENSFLQAESFEEFIA